MPPVTIDWVSDPGMSTWSTNMTLSIRALVCMLTGVLAMTGAGNAMAQDTPAVRIDANGDPLPNGALARLGTLRWRHPQPVTFVAFLPDGKAVLTGSDDRVLRLWDRATGKEIRRFTLQPERPIGTDRFVRAGKFWQGMVAALSDDGKTLAAVAGNPIVLWDVATGRKTREIEAPPVSTIAIALTPDGKILAVRGTDESVFVFATDTGKTIGPPAQEMKKGGPRFPSDFNTVAFSPDGKRIATKQTELQPVHKTFVVVRDVATGKELWRRDTEQQVPTLAVAFAPTASWWPWG